MLAINQIGTTLYKHMTKIEELEKAIETQWIENDKLYEIDMHRFVDSIINGLGTCHKEHYCIWREMAQEGF